MKRIAIYPGSFDPPTNGHLDLIERGSKIFDQLVVALLRNPEKDPLFTLAERREMMKSLTQRFGNVRVDTFHGLLVDYAVRQKAQAVLRGIRAISDYEYELQMALMNRRLEPRLETVFMMPAEQYSYLSSRLIKEIFRLGGNVRGLVPEIVERRLSDKVRRLPQRFAPGETAASELMNSAPAPNGSASRSGRRQAAKPRHRTGARK